MSYYVIFYEIYVLFIISYIVPCILYIWHIRSGVFDIMLITSSARRRSNPNARLGLRRNGGGAGGVDAGVHVTSLPLWMQPLGRLLKLNFATFFRKIIQQWCSQSRLHFLGETSASHPPLSFVPAIVGSLRSPKRYSPATSHEDHIPILRFFFNPQRVTMWICSTCQMSDHLDGTKSSANLFILNLCISHDCLLRPS